jgi:hypothetical protein
MKIGPGDAITAFISILLNAGTNRTNDGVDTVIEIGLSCRLVRRSKALINGSGTYCQIVTNTVKLRQWPIYYQRESYTGGKVAGSWSRKKPTCQEEVTFRVDVHLQLITAPKICQYNVNTMTALHAERARIAYHRATVTVYSLINFGRS